MRMKYVCFLFVTVAVRSSLSACLPPDNNDHLILSPKQASYPTWFRVTLSCLEGYTPPSQAYSYCMDSERWSPPFHNFICLAQCKAPEVTSMVQHFPLGLEPGASKTLYDHEEVINYQCSNPERATLVGPTKATCIDGAWQPADVPTCSQCNAPHVSDVKTVQVTPAQEAYATYAMVHLSCANVDRFSARGPTESYCEEGGLWNPDPTKMTCHEKCITPLRDNTVRSYPFNGTPEDAKDMYDFNEVIMNMCLGEKMLVGPSMQRCVNGAWFPDEEVICH